MHPIPGKQGPKCFCFTQEAESYRYLLHTYFRPKSGAVDKFVLRLINDRTNVAKKEKLYTALGYRWSQAKVSSTTGNYLIPIPSILFQGVLNGCMSDDEGLWIDQVCIERDKEDETMRCVEVMDIIYKCASWVVVVLTDVQADEEETAALRACIDAFEASEVAGYGIPNSDEVPSYISSRPLLRVRACIVPAQDEAEQ